MVHPKTMVMELAIGGSRGSASLGPSLAGNIQPRFNAASNDKVRKALAIERNYGASPALRDEKLARLMDLDTDLRNYPHMLRGMGYNSMAIYISCLSIDGAINQLLGIDFGGGREFIGDERNQARVRGESINWLDKSNIHCVSMGNGRNAEPHTVFITHYHDDHLYLLSMDPLGLNRKNVTMTLVGRPGNFSRGVAGVTDPAIIGKAIGHPRITTMRGLAKYLGVSEFQHLQLQAQIANQDGRRLSIDRLVELFGEESMLGPAGLGPYIARELPPPTLNKYGKPGDRRGGVLNRVFYSKYAHGQFPVPFHCTALDYSVDVKPGKSEVFQLGDTTTARNFELLHPQDCDGWEIIYNSPDSRYRPIKIVHASDHESKNDVEALKLGKVEYAEHPPSDDAMQDATVVIGDGAYTVEEYLKCVGWGHDPFDVLIDRAGKAGAKLLAVVHLTAGSPSHVWYDKLGASAKKAQQTYPEMKIIAGNEGARIGIRADGSIGVKNAVDPMYLRRIKPFVIQ